MTQTELNTFIDTYIANVGRLIPQYTTNPLDNGANGNVAICIMDNEGNVRGKIWGKNKVVGRSYFRNAWVKCSQTWITGLKTGEYEKRLFNNEFKEEDFGIQMPDLIGWEGGQPLTLNDGTVLSVGFSGFRGINDLDIVTKALENCYK